MEWKLYETWRGRVKEGNGTPNATRNLFGRVGQFSVSLCPSALFALARSLSLFLALFFFRLRPSATRFLHIQAKLGYELGMIRGSVYRVSIFGILHLYD